MADEPIKQPSEPEPIKPKCTGHSSKTGKPCRLSPVHGATVCHKHGAAAPQVKRAAARRVAIAEFGKAFGEIAPDADPHEVILTEIRWTSGHVAWLRQRVQEADPEALVWGVESEVTRRSGEFPGVDTTSAAKASAWLVLYGQERDRLVKQCEIAIRAGIELRYVELAERVGEVLGDLIAAILDDLDLTPEQEQAAAVSLPRHLQLVAGRLNGGGA